MTGSRRLRPAVFLDRDGTLNLPVITAGRAYPPRHVDDFRLFPDVADGCRRLSASGFVLVVATNQPDVGRGEQTQEAVEAIHRRLRNLVPEIAHIETCYDPGRSEASRRRKPEPGMLLDASAALDLDLTASWMIGDRWRDIDCGRRAGVRTIFIDFGYDEHLREQPEFTVSSFAEAVAVILTNAARSRAE